MEEIVIKLDMPSELARTLKPALEKALKDLERKIMFSLADEILSKSELTDEQIKEMVDKAKTKETKRFGLL